MKSLILICLLIILNSCSLIGNSKHRVFVSLDKAMKLVPEKSDQNSVQAMLGSADVIMQVPNSEDIAWIFKDKNTGHQKLSIVFDNQKKLQSVLWLVSEGEPEINLENSKRLFPNAEFKAEKALWENPHAAPHEKLYVDRENGISITFREARQEVESISWYNPTKKTSMDRKPAVEYEL